MKIYDLFEKELFAEMVGQGFVRVKPHPKAPLWIANYAEKTVYSKTWNDVTTQCRGLIFDDDHNIVARPWRKFWNLGEHSDIEGLLHGKVEVTDKMDGSLGILYWDGDDWAISTRGSFQSEQAIKATEMLRTTYRDFVPDPGFTYLFEIIYPENRIVLNYGERKELVLLGGVNINSGYSYGPTAFTSWTGPKTKVFAYANLGSAMAASPRANAEGLVVRFFDTDLQVKIKQESYIVLHRLITGLSQRSVWEALGVGQTVEEICAPLPDEFHDWVRQVANDLKVEQKTLLFDLDKEFASIYDEDRKTFALRAKMSKSSGWLFTLYDKRDPGPAIWASLKPSAETRWGNSGD